jgi:CheY-like chemotaxis protein
MGGELRVMSVLGQGSMFQFTIPVNLVPAGALTSQFSNRKVIGLAPDQPRYRLLVVEDHHENRQFLVQLLQSIGFEVREAESGQDAVQLWQNWRPDLIWMDIRMPGMNGYEATRQIRDLEAKGKTGRRRQEPGESQKFNSTGLDAPTKILALTASAFQDERAAILVSGCDDFVCKPVTEAVLLNKLVEHIGVRYLYQEKIDVSQQEVSLETDGDSLSTLLQVMPPVWIAQLQRAARTADEEAVLQMLEQIPPTHDVLADALKELVNELRLDKLIELTTDFNN